MLVAYVIMSLIIGIIDVRRIVLQDQYFDTVPIGDIGDCIEPKPILGIHNFIFLPSWFVIGAAVLISRIINQ